MKTTTKLALSSLKTGKIRSILTGTAIFLTTMLITIIVFGCSSIIRYNKSNAAEFYGEHYGVFNSLTPEQIQSVSLHPQFYHIGFQSYVGDVIHREFEMRLYTTDAAMRQLAHFQPESGSYPTAENEILAQREFFQTFGYAKANLGDTVTIPFRINGEGKIIEKEFVISGFLTSATANELAKRYSAYVSEDFLTVNIPDERKRHTFVGFQVTNEEQLNADEMKQKIYSLADDLGIRENQVSVNRMYLTWALDPDMETITAGVCIIAVIIAFAVLVIYNLFHVAIMQRIREYGRLKALGANKKQLKQMVRMEGLLLSAASIPAGILCGSLLLKLVLSFLYQQPLTVFYLPLTLVILLLSLFTVLLSMHKPIKIAAKTSPVEAIRYEAGGRERKRKGMESVSIFRLTMSNLSLHKKRTVTTILTMGLSCILFVVIANIVGNMNPERQTREDLEYGRFRITLDYRLNDQTYPADNLHNIQKQNPLGPEFMKQLEAIDGVTDVRSRKIISFHETGQSKATEDTFFEIAVVNEEEFEWLKRNAERGVVDYQNTVSQDGVIYMWDHFLDDGYGIGYPLEGELLDGDRRIPFSAPIVGSCGHSNDATVTMTEETFQKLNLTEDMTAVLFVDCDQDREAEVKHQLEQIISVMEHISLQCFDDSLELNDFQVAFIRNACYTFLAILGMIGFMNMANTMIINILTRKREFGMMQAIGMTNRQLNQMLQLEGLVFTAGTLLISLALGNILGYYAFTFCKKQGIVGLFQYHAPLPELSVLILGIISLQSILAFALSRNVKKESLIERIME